jgi:RNA polymerase sigma factor (sigma-70 family)
MTAVPHWDLVGPAETDADLVRAATAGDRGAFAGIYDRYADRLYDFCVGMLRDRDDAADCVQDAFCAAATRLNQLRDADKLRPWLYSIARNEALRKLRDRRRESVFDEMPETVSNEPGPETLAARNELADLVSEAAGGLSDRDKAILDLAYRHGLDGPDLAQALDVSPANATKMISRLRETVEKALGALLVARRICNTGAGCAELAAILEGWDGHFTVLMRKRIARHIEDCPNCTDERRRLVSPVALLGAIPAFLPAPAALRERTLNGITLAPMTSPLETESAAAHVADSSGASAGSTAPTPHVDDAPHDRARKVALAVGLLAIIAAVSLGLTITWKQHKDAVDIAPADVKQTETQPISSPGSQTPSQIPTATTPAAEPPTMPSTPTTTVPMPPAVVENPTPVTIYDAPPTRRVDPTPPALVPPPELPAPQPPSLRKPAGDLPNDVVTAPTVRSQPTGIAGIPTREAAPTTRRANNPPPAPDPTQRRVVRGLPSDPDPPR